MAATDRTTEELAADLSAVAKGDRQALKRIFDAEAGRLIAIAERIVRRRDLAEDVVQDAFVTIWQKAHQYSTDRGSARGWIHAIVRNRALNILRDGKREDLMDGNDLETLQEADQSDTIMSAWTSLDSHQAAEALPGGTGGNPTPGHPDGLCRRLQPRRDRRAASPAAWHRQELDPPRAASLRECMA